MRALAGFCRLIVAAGVVVLPATTAGATAVTVGGHYMESSERHSSSPPTTTSCTNVLTCYIIFNVIPAGKQLVVSHLTCRVGVNGATPDLLSIATLMTYSTAGATDRESNLPPIKVVSSGPTNQFYNVSGAVYHLFKAGERPVVRFVLQGTNQVIANCSISGRVGNPPD